MLKKTLLQMRRNQVIWFGIISCLVALLASVSRAAESEKPKFVNIGPANCRAVRELHQWCSMTPEAIGPDLASLWKNAVQKCETGEYGVSAELFAELKESAAGITCGIGGENGPHDLASLAGMSRMVQKCLHERQGISAVFESFDELANYLAASIREVRSSGGKSARNNLEALMSCGMWRRSMQSDVGFLESSDRLIRFRTWESSEYVWSEWQRFPDDRHYSNIAFVPKRTVAAQGTYEYGLEFAKTPFGWTWVGVSLFMVKPFHPPEPTANEEGK